MCILFLIQAPIKTSGIIGAVAPVTEIPEPAPWPLVSLEERRLLEAAAAGDQKACAVLVKRHRSAVFAIALRLTANRSDADEVTQDALLRAFRYLPNFRGESSFKTWLLRITGRVAIDHLRRKRLETISLDAPESPAARLPEKSPGGLQHLLHSERNDLLNKAMQDLSKEDASALQLFYFHEKSIQEITVVMGWTESNTKSRLSRARQRLRVVLMDKYAGELEEWH
jgi:RNA polymerase sigma factor (sigma-70 family)